MNENRDGGWFAMRIAAIREKTDVLRQDPATRRLLLTLAIALAAAIACFWFYNATHLFDDYRLRARVELDDIDGTQYEMLGGKLIKYSPDGVFCVTKSNELKWSAAYTMQTPISQVCGKSMVIAEQQGNLVYVINEDGVAGHFETSLPIIKARVSSGGTTALLLSDSDVSWITLYDTAGNTLATVKTTLSESGYPLDVAITPNAKRMIISFLQPSGGTLKSSISVYDFSSSEDADDTHLIGTETYERMVFPEVYFADSDTPVAVGDSGFAVFRAGNTLKERTFVPVDREIVSCFHDKENLGFIFHSTQTDMKYDMEIYNYNGKRSMESSFDFEFSGTRMENGEILLYDAKDLNVYRTSGRQKLHAAYDKEVLYFTSVPGFRRYLVVTEDSLDQIRIT